MKENNSIPQIILMGLLTFFVVIYVIQGQSLSGLFADVVMRVGMNGFLVLAMVPGILCGIGLNFGLSIGICCGLLAGCLSIEADLRGMVGFCYAIILAILFSALCGFLYGKFLNRVEGSEMTISTYVGFSVVSLLSIGWTVFPFHSSEMVWAIGGKGLRTTISLSGRFEKILDTLIPITIGEKTVAIGTVLFFLLSCFLFHLFLKTKTGHAMKATGENTLFAKAEGFHTSWYRILGVMISTCLGGIGILVYSQSYGFMQLYQAPLMMPFSAVAAILIGGASIKKATISHAILGVIFLQLLISVSTPVINRLLPDSSLGESVRVLISYGVILYALMKAGGVENGE